MSPAKAGDGGISAESTAWLFYQSVWRLHGLPSTIVSDRGSQFVSLLWQQLCKILGIQARLSTAFHPQTDGQSENANQEMERYLRTFVNYYQDNWDELLPSAEFAVNAAVSETTKCSPFLATRGYSPRMSFDLDKLPPKTSSARERITRSKIRSIVEPMQIIWNWTKAWIAHAQDKQKANADRRRRPVEPTIQEGQKVWLDMRFLCTERPSKKLDSKWEGPFVVVKKINEVAFKLKLPASMKCHPVFHASLLTPDPQDPLPEQDYPQPGPIQVDNEDEFEVEDILDVKRGRGGKLLVRAKWVGWPTDLTWYPIDNFRHSSEILADFFSRNPSKPKPDWMSS